MSPQAVTKRSARDRPPRQEPPERRLPVAVEEAFQLWMWLDQKAVKMPVHARIALGTRMVDAVLAVLDLLTQAAFESAASVERPVMLREANRRVAFLRMLLRGARERRYLTLDEHAHAAVKLDGIGRMVGAWHRSARGDVEGGLT